MRSPLLLKTLTLTSPLKTVTPHRRSFISCSSATSAADRKVSILGAAGGIGQPLSMLMKLHPLVSSLSLYDIAATPGIAADVSHVSTRPEVAGFVGEEEIGEALKGSDLVIIPAGVPRKPGMTRDDLFNINAGIVKSLCVAVAKHCPNSAAAAAVDGGWEERLVRVLRMSREGAVPMRAVFRVWREMGLPDDFKERVSKGRRDLLARVNDLR